MVRVPVARLLCACALGCVLARATPLHAQVGASRGTTHGGRLVGSGSELPLRGDGFHFGTNRGNPDARYGTPALVAAIVRAAGLVARAHGGGGDLLVNDISRPGGGPIRGHASHRSGRDADIGYYAVDAAGAPVALARPLAFGARGEGRATLPDGRAVRLDVARTWAFMAALLSDPEITVQRLFIYPPLRALLLAHARTAGADASLLARAAAALRPPRREGAALHDDHFHVRVACGPDDARVGCRD